MLDLARIRDDLAYFASLLGQPLRDWQRLTLDVTFLCIVAGRQLGKSRFAAIAALWMALRKPDQLIILASASEEGARRLLGMARTYARALPALEASFEDDQLGLLRLSNGSVIRAIATSESAARGWTADVVFVDEAQLCPRTFIDALLPVIVARENAQVVFLGTGGVSEGAFFDTARAGEVGAEGHRTVKWIAKVAGGTEDAPWIRASVVEAARQSMTASRFAAEYQASFAAGGDVLFPLSLLERSTADYACETETLAQLQPAARGCLGVDWGERADRCGAVRVERIAGTRHLGISAVRRWAAGEPIPDVVSEIAESPAHYGAIISERNGLGAPASQYLEKAVRLRAPAAGGGRRRGGAGNIGETKPPRTGARSFRTSMRQIFTTAPMKAAGFGIARLMLERGQLVIPAGATELRTELMHLRSELTQSGVERIAAGWGHDDLAMAMLMALLPQQVKEPGGEAWRLRLSDFSDPRRPVPPVDASMVEIVERGGATVVTGTGAEIPRRPTWQSILSGEVTAPSSTVDVFDPRDSKVAREVRERIAEAQNQKEAASVTE
jgi:hypothetical protein